MITRSESDTRGQWRHRHAWFCRRNPCRVLTRSTLALLILSALALSGLPSRPILFAHAASGDWTMYLGGLDRTGFNPNESVVSASSAAAMQLSWSYQAGPAGSSSQPIVYAGKVYWGAWDCYMRAFDLTGNVVWRTLLGGNSACPGYARIAGTPTIGTVQINNQPVTLLFAVAGSSVYALDPTSGHIVWHSVPLAGDIFWSSPAFYQGDVYVGTVKGAGATSQAGSIVQVDGATGTLLRRFKDGPDGCPAAGPVWGSPTIDTASGTLYYATGDPNGCTNPGSYYIDAVVALNASDLSFLGAWRLPSWQVVLDGDFGDTPTLFSATINGTVRNLLGVANKNGNYYVFDRTNIAAGPIWQRNVGIPVNGIGGAGPEFGEGTVSPSGWDGHYLYVAGGIKTLNNVTCFGSLQKLDPATGRTVWSSCFQDGPIVGAVTLVPGLAIVGEGPDIKVLDTGNGVVLSTYTSPANKQFYGAATVANGALYQADSGGALYALATSDASANVAASPSSGTYLQKVTAEAHGFTPGQTVNLYWDSTSTSPIATTTANSSGVAVVAFAVPDEPFGSHTLVASQAGGASASTPFQVVPQVMLTKAATAGGSTDTITGAGFGPNETVNIYWHSVGSTPLTTASTNGNGDFAATSFKTHFTAYGPTQVYAAGQGSGRTASAIVMIVPSAGVSPSSGAGGSAVTVSGHGFMQSEPVSIYWNCSSAPCSGSPLATPKSAGGGSFSASVNLPTAPPGTTYPILLEGKNSNLTAITRFNVTS